MGTVKICKKILILMENCIKWKKKMLLFFLISITIFKPGHFYAKIILILYSYLTLIWYSPTEVILNYLSTNNLHTWVQEIYPYILLFKETPLRGLIEIVLQNKWNSQNCIKGPFAFRSWYEISNLIIITRNWEARSFLCNFCFMVHFLLHS